MGEIIMLGILKSALAPVMTELVKKALTRNPRNQVENVPIKINNWCTKERVEEGKVILDNGKDLDLKKLKNLAVKLTIAETYEDTINYIFKHKFEGIINWAQIELQVVELLGTLEPLIHELSGQPSENQPSGSDMEGQMPPCNVRRCLLYLSRFPKGYVFNSKRISRLSVAHEFIAADSSEPLQQKLIKWLEVVDSNWDGNRAPNHFLIGHNVGEQTTKKWPESHKFVREAIVEINDSIRDEIFLSSLIILRGTYHTLNLEERNFLFLKTLSIRNITLENEIHLKKLSLLKYLDLKYTIVRGCDWLEGLEELQMLDLRYTLVEEIPDKCLEKLGKLQHLLLGYCPKKGDNRLAGAKLSTKMLKTTNLKTLRAIRLHKDIAGTIHNVVDLSVTGLSTEKLKRFWGAVSNFKKLTSLGVAVTENSVITLEDCPANLKDKLKRLRMEGQFSDCSTSAQPHSRLAKLREFENLIDLTLASHKPIDIGSIPPLPKLICLRLYSFCTETTLTFGVQGLKSLKKLVIGDMAKVETVEIARAVIEKVTTFKLRNLPKFRELVCLESKSKGAIEEFNSHKTIFLRATNNIFKKSPRLKVYHYDMNKQCYKS